MPRPAAMPTPPRIGRRALPTAGLGFAALGALGATPAAACSLSARRIRPRDFYSDAGARRAIARPVSVANKGQTVTQPELDALPPVAASTGGLFTQIADADPARPFVAKFHRLGMPGQREQAMAIAAGLGGAAPHQECRQALFRKRSTCPLRLLPLVALRIRERLISYKNMFL